MKNNFKLIWIDDDLGRIDKFKGAIAGPLRGQDVTSEIETFRATGKVLEDLSPRAEAWKSNPPDLVLIDHDFSKADRRMFDLQGAGLAQLLRNILPSVPMVCVTGQNVKSEKFNQEDLSAYTYLFEINAISEEENLELLFSIANDFKLLTFGQGESPRHKLVQALQAPDSDEQILLSILPPEFESGFVHGTSPHRMAQWILNVLLKKPGFLLDPLEAATLLGLAEPAFTQRIRPLFEKARYRGPFWTEARPLWWASTLPDVLYEILPDAIGMQTREAGRKLEGVLEADFSRCHETGEHTPPPDVVAYTDSTKSVRTAVRHRYTIPVSDDAAANLGFATELKIRKDY